MFISLVTVFLSMVSVYAFEGQPKEILVMPSMDRIQAVALPDLNMEDIVKEQWSCEANSCFQLAKVNKDLYLPIGQVQYKINLALVEINKEGQIMTPFHAKVIYTNEVNTNSRLILSLDETRATACFGTANSNNGSSCSFFKINSTY